MSDLIISQNIIKQNIFGFTFGKNFDIINYNKDQVKEREILYFLSRCEFPYRKANLYNKGMNRMKINYYCLRDVMLAIEDHEYIDPELNLYDLWHNDLLELPSLALYNKQDITYAAMIGIESGLIVGQFGIENDEINYMYIKRLTAKGHDFIENIRPDSVWETICSFGEDIGTLSIEMIRDTAPKVIAQLLARNFYRNDEI